MGESNPTKTKIAIRLRLVTAFALLTVSAAFFIATLTSYRSNSFVVVTNAASPTPISVASPTPFGAAFWSIADGLVLPLEKNSVALIPIWNVTETYTSFTIVLERVATQQQSVLFAQQNPDGFTIADDSVTPFGAVLPTDTLAPQGAYLLHFSAQTISGQSRTQAVRFTVAFVEAQAGAAPPPRPTPTPKAAPYCKALTFNKYACNHTGALEGTGLTMSDLIDDFAGVFVRAVPGSTTGYNPKEQPLGRGPGTFPYSAATCFMMVGTVSANTFENAKLCQEGQEVQSTIHYPWLQLPDGSSQKEVYHCLRGQSPNPSAPGSMNLPKGVGALPAGGYCYTIPASPVSYCIEHCPNNSNGSDNFCHSPKYACDNYHSVDYQLTTTDHNGNPIRYPNPKQNGKLVLAFLKEYRKIHIPLENGNIMVAWRDAPQSFKNPAQIGVKETKSRFHAYLLSDTCGVGDQGKHVCFTSVHTVYTDNRLADEKITDIACPFE